MSPKTPNATHQVTWGPPSLHQMRASGAASCGLTELRVLWLGMKICCTENGSCSICIQIKIIRLATGVMPIYIGCVHYMPNVVVNTSRSKQHCARSPKHRYHHCQSTLPSAKNTNRRSSNSCTRALGSDNLAGLGSVGRGGISAVGQVVVGEECRDTSDGWLVLAGGVGRVVLTIPAIRLEALSTFCCSVLRSVVESSIRHGATQTLRPRRNGAVEGEGSHTVENNTGRKVLLVVQLEL